MRRYDVRVRSCPSKARTGQVLGQFRQSCRRPIRTEDSRASDSTDQPDGRDPSAQDQDGHHEGQDRADGEQQPDDQRASPERVTEALELRVDRRGAARPIRSRCGWLRGIQQAHPGQLPIEPNVRRLMDRVAGDPRQLRVSQPRRRRMFRRMRSDLGRLVVHRVHPSARRFATARKRRPCHRVGPCTTMGTSARRWPRAKTDPTPRCSSRRRSSPQSTGWPRSPGTGVPWSSGSGPGGSRCRSRRAVQMPSCPKGVLRLGKRDEAAGRRAPRSRGWWIRPTAGLYRGRLRGMGARRVS